MTHNDANKATGMTEKEDKYTGMRALKLGLSPTVILCAIGGAVLGLILALWSTSEIGIVAATVFIFAILSGIFGMFL
jgi:hypothetical protein